MFQAFFEQRDKNHAKYGYITGKTVFPVKIHKFEQRAIALYILQIKAELIELFHARNGEKGIDFGQIVIDLNFHFYFFFAFRGNFGKGRKHQMADG